MSSIMKANYGRRFGRIDQPRNLSRVVIPRPHYDPDTFGRLSERIARFLGTGRFLVWMTVVVGVWVLWNAALPHAVRFDDYPFIFLTLMLSLQASYAAPLILLAQNRQDDRDRVQYEQDRARAEQDTAEMEYLTREIASIRLALNEVATREWIRDELQRILMAANGAPVGAVNSTGAAGVRDDH